MSYKLDSRFLEERSKYKEICRCGIGYQFILKRIGLYVLGVAIGYIRKEENLKGI